MQKAEALSTVTKDDLKLIVGALSAYQHNTCYRALLEKLKRHQIAAGKTPGKSTVLIAVR